MTSLDSQTGRRASQAPHNGGNAHEKVLHAPALSLPRGGGAMRAIGEDNEMAELAEVKGPGRSGSNPAQSPYTLRLQKFFARGPSCLETAQVGIERHGA
jgi:hypothetical protein